MNSEELKVEIGNYVAHAIRLTDTNNSFVGCNTYFESRNRITKYEIIEREMESLRDSIFQAIDDNYKSK